MAKKEVTITLVLSDDGTSFIPVDTKALTPLMSGKDVLIGSVPGLTGLRAQLDITDFVVPVSIYSDRNVEVDEDLKDNKIYLKAPRSVLSKYNPNYAPKESTIFKPVSSAEEIQERIKTPKPKTELVKVDPNKVEQKIKEYQQNVGAQEEITFSNRFYTYDELLSPETGAGLANQDPLNPDSRELFVMNITGDLAEPTEAVLLPASSATTSSSFSGEYYYVAPIGQAVDEVIKTYVAENSIMDLKQKLLSAGFMSPDDYNLSIGTVNEMIADASTKTAVANALVDLSANSFQRLREGDKKVFDFSDWLTVKQTSERSAGQVTLPGAGAMKQVLDSQYQKFYNRKSTQEEFLTYQEQVMQAAVDNVQKSQTLYSTDGQAVEVTTGGFSDTDLFQVAESLTKGTEEREQYYGANRLNRLTMQAFNQSFGSGQASLEELLR
jgi:hypothetical protein